MHVLLHQSSDKFQMGSITLFMLQLCGLVFLYVCQKELLEQHLELQMLFRILDQQYFQLLQAIQYQMKLHRHMLLFQAAVLLLDQLVILDYGLLINKMGVKQPRLVSKIILKFKIQIATGI
ncbi:unnamed protein product [Paramecium primaurelia]|uniref:Transmembrane protein n=1 Tax=Paramecium primaurelia TaxID=5886 RepID=A0A8S1K8B1_PARPR|nr:unnamed protein product [Paramecium primaurelia]